MPDYLAIDISVYVSKPVSDTARTGRIEAIFLSNIVIKTPCLFRDTKHSIHDALSHEIDRIVRRV